MTNVGRAEWDPPGQEWPLLFKHFEEVWGKDFEVCVVDDGPATGYRLPQDRLLHDRRGLPRVPVPCSPRALASLRSGLVRMMESAARALIAAQSKRQAASTPQPTDDWDRLRY